MILKQLKYIWFIGLELGICSSDNDLLIHGQECYISDNLSCGRDGGFEHLLCISLPLLPLVVLTS